MKKKHHTPQPPAVAPKIMPQAPDLEEVVLGALLIERTAYDRVGDMLRPEHFYVRKNQLVFEAIQSLAFESNAIDMLTVTERLKKMGFIDEVGGAFYIAQLTLNVASSAHIESHALILVQKALSRSLITYGSEIQTSAYDETIDVHETLQNAEEMIFRLSETQSMNSMKTMSEILKDTHQRLVAASASADSISGLRSGFKDIDRITAGWQKADLIIIAARPAMGKTAFLLTMAKNMTMIYGLKVGIFSLEMSSSQLCIRLISNVANLPSDRLRRGMLNADDWHEMERSITPLYENHIYIDDKGGISVLSLKSSARRLKRQYGIDCIMIDYLQLMCATGTKFQNREQEVSIISRSLKELAKELDIPVIALSQLNRGIENRHGENKRPHLSDLRESGAIEQDADIVCFLHRPEYYRIIEDLDGKSLEGVAEFIIAKNRNGATADIRLRFIKELVKFEDMEE